METHAVLLYIMYLYVSYSLFLCLCLLHNGKTCSAFVTIIVVRLVIINIDSLSFIYHSVIDDASLSSSTTRYPHNPSLLLPPPFPLPSPSPSSSFNSS